jgi:hypothetical protein
MQVGANAEKRGTDVAIERNSDCERGHDEEMMYATTLVDALKQTLEGEDITYVVPATGLRIGRRDGQANVRALRLHGAAARTPERASGTSKRSRFTGPDRRIALMKVDGPLPSIFRRSH